MRLSKSKMKILIRADSSSKIGIGHIVRSLVLASRYKKDNIVFACRDLMGNINRKIIEQGYRVNIVKTTSFDELDLMIKSLQIELLIIDHYEIDYQFEKALKTSNKTLKILAIDDNYNPHYCDILLNHNIYAKKERYLGIVPDFCEIRCGEKYSLIRDEFIEEKKRKREKIFDITIMMGGADSAGLSGEILSVLPSDLSVAVITTSANLHLAKLQNFAKNSAKTTLFIDSNEVAKLLNMSRFAVVSASTAAQEALFLGVPFLALQVAPNQADMFAWLKENGFRAMCGFEKSEFAKQIALIYT